MPSALAAPFPIVFVEIADTDTVMVLPFWKKIFFIFCLYLYNGILMYPHNAVVSRNEKTPISTADSEWDPIFPQALFSSSYSVQSEKIQGPVNYHDIQEIQNKAQSRLQSVLLNNDIFALYGKPNAYTMGILGQYPLDTIEPVMEKFVTMYDTANGRRGIIPAFYIIYGTCWPQGEIGLLSDSTTKQYIEFAAERGWYVFLDHQIGKYSVQEAVKKLLPYLHYPNVHLALDPEWRTTKPMKEIGTVTADELNTAQQIIQDYMIEHRITGRKMLVVHQFNARMITKRHLVKTNYKRVLLIHCADGHGPPRLKKDTYQYNAQAKNIPLKSFKLFLKPTVDGAGYDIPLMTPEEVLKLTPRPYLIMYQ